MEGKIWGEIVTGDSSGGNNRAQGEVLTARKKTVSRAKSNDQRVLQTETKKVKRGGKKMEKGKTPSNTRKAGKRGRASPRVKEQCWCR